VLAGLAIAAAMAGGCGGSSGGAKKSGAPPDLHGALPAAVASFRAKAGASARLVKVTLRKQEIEFLVRQGSGVHGLYAKPPKYDELQQLPVGISRRLLRTLKPFTVGSVPASAPQRITRSIKQRERAKSVALVEMVLSAHPGSALRWSIAATADGRQVAYVASASGSRVTPVGKPRPKAPPPRPRTPAGTNKQKATPRAKIPRSLVRKRLQQARAIERCIAHTNGNQKKIKECNDKVLKAK
jgi:hypothetical protein